MTNILSLLLGLLAGLRGTIAQAAAPAWPRRSRASRAAPARAQSEHNRIKPSKAQLPDSAAIEHAMGELFSLFAQWQSGTLPPQPASAPRYIPHPSWQPVWLRRRPTPAPPRPPAARRTQARALRLAPAPEHPQTILARAPIPHRVHATLSHSASSPGRALSRPAIHPHRGQAPTPPTP